MPLFGAVHISILTGILLAAFFLGVASRIMPDIAGPVHRLLGWALALNELVWWAFRYSQEGLRPQTNLPLQLCDITVWSTVIACIALKPRAIEFSYFAGIAGAGMALLQPDLWSAWPSYPAIYFFLAHGGVVCAISVLIFGGAVRLRYSCVWRAYGLLLAWSAFVGLADYLLDANYMYLRYKPVSASLLNLFGPWPQYLGVSALVALALFWVLWIPVRPAISTLNPVKHDPYL